MQHKVDKYLKGARILETLRQHVIQYKGHEIKDDISFCLHLEFASGGSLADHIGGTWLLTCSCDS